MRVLILVVACLIIQTLGKNIKVSVKTSWKETSLLAEASEFVFSQDGAGFWKFVESASEDVKSQNNETASPSQKLLYDSLLAVAEKAFSTHTLCSLKYALSLRYYSPLVETQYQFARKYIASTPKVAKSDSFAVVTGTSRFFFSVDTLKAYLSSEECAEAQGTEEIELFDFDHIYPRQTSKASVCPATVVLYADVGTEGFHTFHQYLKAEAGSKYVLRHHKPGHFEPGYSNVYPSLGEASAPGEAEWHSKISVQGYGVELQIKNMEYKNVDDKASATESEEEVVEDEELDMDTGFNFDVLLQRNPTLAEPLNELKEALLQEMDSLRTGEDEDEDIKVWQLQDLGLQSAYKILRAASPLEALTDVSQNFPKRVGAISKISTKSKQYKTFLAGFKKFSGHFREGQSALYINGRETEINTLSPFTLFETVNSEGLLVSRLRQAVKKLGSTDEVEKELMHELMTTPMAKVDVEIDPWTGQRIPIGDEDRFQFKAKEVTWLNDIEKDSMYSSWSKPLQNLLMPSYYGQPNWPRRNIFNMIAIVDASKKEELADLGGLLQMYRQQVPIRMGVVLVCPDALTQVQKMRMADDIVISSSSTDLEEKVSLKFLSKSSDISGISVDVDGNTVLVGKAETAQEEVQEYVHQESIAAEVIAVFEAIAKNDPFKAVQFLSKLGTTARLETVTSKEVRKALQNSPVRGVNYDDAIKNKQVHENIKSTALYVVDRGLTSSRTCLFNGLLTQGKDPKSVIYDTMQKEQRNVVNMIQNNQLKDSYKNMYNRLLKAAGTADRYNPLVFEGHDFLVSDQQAELLSTLAYVYAHNCSKDTLADITHQLVIDPSLPESLAIAIQALNHMSMAAKSSRLAFVFKDASSVLSHAIEAMIRASDGPNQASTVLQFVVLLRKAVIAAGPGGLSLFDVKEIAVWMDEAQNKDDDSHSDDDGNVYKKKSFSLRLSFNLGKFVAHTDSVTSKSFEAHAALASSLKLPCLLTNGRLIKMTRETGTLLSEDYQALEELERKHRATGLKNLLSASKADTQKISDAIPALTSILGADWYQNGARETDGIPDMLENKTYYGFGMKPKESLSGPGEEATLNIIAVIDPISADAQKLSTFLQSLHDAFSAHISVYLNPLTMVDGLPLKSFYRYVLAPEIVFDSVQGTILPPTAYFTNLPSQKILTMAVEAPDNWIVMSNYAPYDLDNIKLENVDRQTLYAEYELEHLLVSGSCIDKSQGKPPRGLELMMHNDVSEDDSQDTLVMSNFGYFQLKGTPGVWRLGLKEGSRGAKIFDIESQFTLSFSSTEMEYKTETVTNVAVTKFGSSPVQVRLVRREGMENEDLLSEDQSDDDSEAKKEDEPSMWKSFSSLLKTDTKENNAEGEIADVPRTQKPVTLNIMSVASGHLYERLLKVMIHTVVNHTKHNPDAHVKFWFVKNFLSPQFKRFLPYYAEKWEFSFELVTYNWPTWLRAQTEKQRIIWAYKILFLDVLFPLSLDKVIFVDADQIVRSDLHELYNMDLKGKPLAYTPFCNSRKETEGFRFWKGGYWEGHLRGLPYHISALYVVDIKRFRQMAAGDNMRMVYDNLSQDPNSLANLDQDLPNYSQHYVPIHSLPLKWLWCETWCDDESKAEAKTIDLCNNPLTKTPKLEAARRIIPEWDEYDQTIAKFEEDLNLPKW